jgi:protein-S-isoprenylcysteine O-methyltransferase Ste14
MFAHRIPHAIVQIGQSMMLPESAAARPADVSGVSQSLAAELLLGLVAGVVASVVVLLGIAGTFVASSAAPPPRLLAVAGWIMLALAIAAVVGSVVSYGVEMRWLSALAKASPG